MGAKASSPAATSGILNDFGEVIILKLSYPVEIRWTIRDFSFHCNNINSVTSPKFSTEDSTWQMIIYPYGCSSESEDYVSISVINSECHDINCSNPKLQKNKSGDFGYNKLVSRNDLLTKLRDSNDELVIICKIKCEDLPTKTYNLNLELSLNYKTSILELLGDFSEILTNAELSDVDMIAADGNVFKVHKAVLAARSDVFLAMFRNSMLEHHTSIVKVKDVEGPILEQLLKFIYTTKTEITDDNAKGVLLAAEKYNIGGLKNECIDYLRNSINLSNAVELLEFGKKYDVYDLRVKAQTFIAENAEDITQQPEFDLSNLDAEVVNDLFRQMATKPK